MKALTIWQPWATLIACGAKHFETRDWSTEYRGKLAVHAGKRWNEDLLTTCYKDPFRDVLRGTKYERPSNLPRGKILCVTRIARIWKAEELPRHYLNEFEEAFGNFSHGRYAWQLDVGRRLDPPLPARGRPGLWDVDLSDLTANDQ